MIEAFRNDEMINKVGGRFKLCALIQRRWLQLMQGARPMVETKGLTDLDNLPEPDELAQEIIDNIEAGLNSFREIVEALEERAP